MADLSGLALTNVFSALLATSSADLDSFWSVSQIYAFMDEELKRLARGANIYTDRQPVPFLATQPFQSCPTGHLATHMADVAGLVLRNRTLQQLQALAVDWYNSTSPVTAFTIGADGADTIRLYGIPGAALNANLIFQAECVAITIEQTVTPLSPLLDDVMALRAIGECRRAETDAQMPEATAFCEQLIGLYHDAAASYFGKGL